MAVRKPPIRRCVGCGEGKAKKELVRIVRSKDGEVSLDLVGKIAGRGAYICSNLGCFNLALKKKAFERAFEMQIPEDVRQRLEEKVKEVDARHE